MFSKDGTTDLLCHTEGSTWLTVFENWGPSEIFGRKMVEIRGKVSKLHYEEFRDLNRSPNINRAMKSIRMRGSGMWHEWGRRTGAYKVLMGKPEERGPLGRPRH